jgi:hypothetical protein
LNHGIGGSVRGNKRDNAPYQSPARCPRRAPQACPRRSSRPTRNVEIQSEPSTTSHPSSIISHRYQRSAALHTHVRLTDTAGPYLGNLILLAFDVDHCELRLQSGVLRWWLIVLDGVEYPGFPRLCMQSTRVSSPLPQSMEHGQSSNVCVELNHDVTTMAECRCSIHKATA